MSICQARRIARVDLTVQDLEAAEAFYAEALGFRRQDDGPTPRPEAGVRRRRMQLGEQEFELVAFDPPGRPYPPASTANVPWFQHFAIAVGDMARAYGRLVAHAQQPISRGGPQLLPPSTGSVTAYKFRDPDGHPLELSFLPQSPWTVQPDGGSEPFLGLDHTAIAVSDLERSVAFYTSLLGLQVAGQGLNQGPEQDRLDGLDGVVLDIVSLTTPEPGPHIELLHYRAPPPPPTAGRFGERDIAGTRTVLQVDRLEDTLTLPGAATLPADRMVQLRDPDGHLLHLVN